MQLYFRGISAPPGADLSRISARSVRGACRRAWVTAEEAAGKQQRWSKSVPHGTVQRGGANSSHQPPTLPDMPSHSTRENGSYRAQKRGLSVGVLWNFLRTGGRRLAALAVRWLVAGSVPARFACPGQDGGAAGRGLSGVFRRLRLPTMRRAGAGRASAAIPGTGGRAGGPARSARAAAAAVLLAFAALLALPSQAEAQTAYVSNNGQSGSTTVNTNASISQAQGFTTGSQSGGYPLSSVGLKFSAGDANAANLVVAIYSAATGGGPDTVEYTLLNPSTLAIDGTEQLFSAPARESLNNPMFAVSRGRGGLDVKLDDIADRPGAALVTGYGANGRYPRRSAFFPAVPPAAGRLLPCHPVA